MLINRCLAAVIAVAAATASGPVAAQSYADPASGLAVDPPKPFVARAGQPHPEFDITIDVASTTDIGQCTIQFKNLPRNAVLSKFEINALMAKPEWQNVHKSIFEVHSTVTDLATFDHQGYTGIEMTLTPKIGPDAEKTRIFVSNVETAKGRTSVVCVTDKDSLAAALPEFREVRATIRAPE